MHDYSTPTVICHLEDELMIHTCVAYMLSDNKEYAYTHRFRDGQELVDAWPLNPMPQLILLDLGLPRMDGHEVLKWLQSEEIKIPVVLLSSEPNLHKLVVPYMKLNVRAFLNKSYLTEHFLTALDDVMHKGIHCNDIMNAGLAHREDSQSRQTDVMRVWNSLSDKQRKFAELATTHDGETHKQLAVRMNISLGTAKTYARALHAAFGIHSRLQLVLIVKELLGEMA